MTQSFRDHEFVTQYAIRMPDGTLYGCRTYNPAEMMGGMGMVFGPMMGGMLGWGDEDESAEEIITPPSVWYDRKEAERALLSLREMMRQHGIEHWHGEIVERLCSPFTTPRDQGAFVDDIASWLKDQ